MRNCCICQGTEMMDPNEFIHSRIREIMEKKNCCFACAFWFEKLELWRNDRNWLIVDSQSYHVNPTLSKPTVFQGFGGRWFYFKKNDGTLIKSNNVWGQGKIPNHFKEMIPDNAIMITKEEYDLLDKARKMKRAKLYIPIEYNKESSKCLCTLLNASKLKTVKDLIPFEETLKVYMEIQYLKAQKQDNFKPKPFEISVEMEKFGEIILDIKRKSGNHGNVPGTGEIPLFTQYPGIPICIIKMK